MAAIRDIKLGVKIRSEAEIKAEAMREAAAGWPDGQEGFPVLWLEDRAADIEAGREPVDWATWVERDEAERRGDTSRG